MVENMNDLIKNAIYIYNDGKSPTNEELRHWLEINNQSEKAVLKPIGFFGFSGSGLGTGVKRKFN